MRFVRSLLVLVALAPAFSLAQTATPTPDWTPPPMVPASPPPMPAPEPAAPSTAQPNTPPPPGTFVPNPNRTGPGYQYSPYGTPKEKEKPGPEIGLMVSESLFGSLTAAGVTVLPYFLLFNNGTLGDPTLSSIIFCLIFGASPLAVAQTQVSLANGSRYYTSEMWIPALTGLVGMAGVLGVFYATGWLPTAQASGGVPNGGSVAWLMIGAVGLVPLLQMAAINLFKTPRPGFAVLGDPDRKIGVAFAPPVAGPILGPTARGDQLGVQVSLLRGRW
ncbi:MAG TPA: hypothetical protein VGD87_04335 [Archangium sp.]